MTHVGVLVHGGGPSLQEAVVGAVARADDLGEVRGLEVVAAGLEVPGACARLAEVADTVIGLGARPWPGWTEGHAAAHDALGDAADYWAVETWHGLPALHDALHDAVGERWRDGSRVVVTVPDAVVRRLAPEQRVLLRDVAEALHERSGTRPTVAVDRSPDEDPVTPTAVTTVETLAEAHGAGRVVRLSLVPGDGPDPAVTEAAGRFGVDLIDVALDAATHHQLLVEVVRTMLAQALS